MKRKKYVKQLMALGYDRNEANRSANIARVFYTYERALEIVKQGEAFQKAIVRLATTMTDWLTNAAKAATEAVRRISEAVNGVDLAACLDLTKKTATELRAEIAEKLQPPGGGGND